MSDDKTKEKHSKRLHDDETHIKKRQKLLKARSAYLWSEHNMTKQPHRLHKVSGMNCGNPNCVMCGNPRKMFKELTIQEQKFYQEELYDEREVSLRIHEDGENIR